MDRKVRQLVAVIDLVLLKGEVKERDKILDLVNDLRLKLNERISPLGTNKEDLKKVNLQIQYLNKIDSLLRDYSGSKKEELSEARDKYLGEK